MHIDDEEREWRARGYEAGERFWHDWLREHQAASPSPDRWAGHEHEVRQLREEIERLQGGSAWRCPS